MKLNSQMRYLNFVFRKHNIDLDLFYCVTFRKGEVICQGHYDNDLVSRIQTKLNIMFKVDLSGYVTGQYKTINFTLTK